MSAYETRGGRRAPAPSLLDRMGALVLLLAVGAVLGGCTCSSNETITPADGSGGQTHVERGTGGKAPTNPAAGGAGADDGGIPGDATPVDGRSPIDGSNPVDGSTACGLLELIPEGQVTELPALTTVNFQIKDCHGVPVSGLCGSHFTMKEDGEDISNLEAAFATTGLNRDYVVQIMLMLDLSGSITRSGNLEKLKESASKFVNLILDADAAHRSIAVYSFDGNPAIQMVADFTRDASALEGAINGIVCPGQFCTDTTTNLYGAVINGLGALDQYAGPPGAEAPVTGKVFVIFTDGTDRAQTYTEAATRDAVEQATSSIVAVGVEGEYNDLVLKWIGRDGSYLARDYDHLDATFSAVAGLVQAEASSHYTVSFCSDRRNAADHPLDIEVHANGASGVLSTAFPSDGFTGGCTVPVPVESPACRPADAGVAEAGIVGDASGD